MAFRKKNIIYVGGLDSNITEETLLAAFIPFGEIKSVQIPKDFQANKNKGFAFVEYDLEEDAADALDNMDGSELYGKIIRCNITKAIPKVATGKALWTAEEWIQNNLKEETQQKTEEDDRTTNDLELLPSFPSENNH